MEDMTQPTPSTRSYESRRESQSMLDVYVKEMLDCVREDPWISTPGIWEYITGGGPCVRPSRLMHLFGGMGQFRRTCRRTDVLRWVAVEGREAEQPLGQETQTWEEICRRVEENRRDAYLPWRAPDMWSPTMRRTVPSPSRGCCTTDPRRTIRTILLSRSLGMRRLPNRCRIL